MKDLIDRQAVRLIEIDDKSARNYRTYNLDDAYDDGFYDAISAVLELPSSEPEIIRCKDCKWWDREAEDSPMGYCHACKHNHYSRHWEIHIRRTYEEDFFCADAEPKEEEEEEDATD